MYIAVFLIFITSTVQQSIKIDFYFNITSYDMHTFKTAQKLSILRQWYQLRKNVC